MSARTLLALRCLGIGLFAAAAVGATAAPAAAFCGFFVSGADSKLYNNASQVVMMRRGNHTALTMSNNYNGPPQDFAMVVPVPVVLHKGEVKTLRPEVFRGVDTLSSPRLVEYWERDPCYIPSPPLLVAMETKQAAKLKSKKMSVESGDPSELGVTVEDRFQEGEYQILILSAKESGGLDTWLRLNGYKIPDGAAVALAPYIRDQMKFFVAKVDISKVRRDEHGAVVLSPLRFSYDSSELRLPVRLGLLNAQSKQDLLVYILSPDSRYEVANYPNVFIPTNVEVSDSVKGRFGSFYGELMDETLRRAGGRAVVTEFAWQTPILQRPEPVRRWASYHCDPCPAPVTPPPSISDWITLGDKTLLGELAELTPGEIDEDFELPPGLSEKWVLTRLHTRYDQTTLSEDLIFRSAKPAVGGRAYPDGTSRDEDAQLWPNRDNENQFQGRYIIRHYWQGAVACQNPRYGIWSGPPGGGGAQTARDLANAPRGKLSLRAVVRSPIPSLQLPGVPRAPRPGERY